MVQEAFLDLWRQADRFDARQATARSRLLLLTRGKAIARIRRERVRKTLTL